MLYISHGPTYLYNGHIFRIQNKGGIYTKILSRGISQLEAMLTHYQKVFVYRFDLRCNNYSETNIQLSQFISRLKYWVKRQYKSRLGFIWVREQNPPTPTQHYHIAIMINGNKVDTSFRIGKKLKELEAQWQGKIGFAPNPYHRVKRNDFTSVQNAIYRISYLAKVETKASKNKTANAYSCSQIKPNTAKTAFDFDGLESEKP
jgi:hypothetical protein